MNSGTNLNAPEILAPGHIAYLGGFRRAGVLGRYLLAFLARFRNSDGDCLFAALYSSTFAAFTGAERAALLAAHGARDSLAGTLAVAATAGLLLCWHTFLLPFRDRTQA